MTSIFVSTQFEGMHCYPNAPQEVAFLVNMHRHMFHVTLQLEVFHNERELEFFLVKRALDAFIKKMTESRFTSDITLAASCETMAEDIMNWVLRTYALEIVLYGEDTVQERKVIVRKVSVEVSEDGENGSIVTNY